VWKSSMGGKKACPKRGNSCGRGGGSLRSSHCVGKNTCAQLKVLRGVLIFGLVFQRKKKCQKGTTTGRERYLGS